MLKMTKQKVERMEKFFNAMQALWVEAEALRDMTNDHVEKEVFNHLRDEFSINLFDRARYTLLKWKSQL